MERRPPLWATLVAAIFFALVWFVLFMVELVLLSRHGGLSRFGTHLGNQYWQTVPVALLGLGVLLAARTGGIDLSVAAVAGLTGAVTAALSDSAPLVVALVVALMVAVLFGAVQGLLAGVARITPVGVTLAGLFLAEGINLALARNTGIILLDPVDFNTLRPGAIAGVVVLLLFVVAPTAVAELSFRSLPGFRALARDDRPEQAPAGPNLVAAAAYVVGALLAGIAGIIFLGRLGAAAPSASTQLLLSALTACVIGGANLRAGRGSAAGTLGGAVLVVTLTSVGLLAGWSASVQIIALSLLLLVALGLRRLGG